MANSKSTALKQFIAVGGSISEALNNGVVELYSGTRPNNADQSYNQNTATLLAVLTAGGGTFVPEVVPYGTFTVTGGTGVVKGITVSGTQIMPFGALPAYSSSTAAAVALDIISAINAATPITGFWAASGGSAVVNIYSKPGRGPYKTVPGGTWPALTGGAWPGVYKLIAATNTNALPIAASPAWTTITMGAIKNIGDSSLVTSVAPCYGIPFGSLAGAGVFSPGLPIGSITVQTNSCLASGLISWVRFKGSVADASGLDSNTQYLRWDADAAADGSMEFDTTSTPSTTAGSSYTLSPASTTFTEN